MIDVDPNKDEKEEEEGAVSLRSSNSTPPDPQYDRLCKAMSLAIAYAANAGGIATLTGTPPNVVLLGQLNSLYDSDCGINFVSWMAFGLPLSILNMVTCWLWLALYFLGPRQFCCPGRYSYQDQESDDVKEILIREYKKLGPMGYHEWSVLASFILLVSLWITREFEFFPGWGTYFPKGFATDATAPIFVSVLFFVLPSAPFRWSNLKPPKPLLRWEVVHEKMPWSVLLLLGGGFAIADSSVKSGLSDVIGEQLRVLKLLPPMVVVLCVCVLVGLITEVTSNIATVALMLPIMAELSKSINMNPLYLMLPCTLCASFAFMLPVATPPNALVFEYGYLKITDMIKAGFVMNIISIFYVTLGVNTWGLAYFKLDQIPDWAGWNITVPPTVETTTVF